MEKLNFKEEDELFYNIISEALLSLCHQKPDDPIEFLANQLMKISNQDVESLKFPKIEIDTVESLTRKKANNTVKLSTEKIFLSEIKKSFYEKFVLLEKIGDGTQGTVFKCRDKSSETDLRAVKIINKKGDDTLTEDRIRLLKQLMHPNLITIFDVFEDDENILIVEDYCALGDLASYLKKNSSKMNRKTVKSIIGQIIEATYYLHQKKIIHRDIKLNNVLVSYDENEIIVKLGDFGTDIENKSESNLHDIIGTPYFMAPEMLSGTVVEQSDVWSIGAMLYTLLCGEPPFSGKHYDLVFKIINNDVTFKEGHNQEDQAILSKMLTKNPNERIQLTDLLDHDYFKNEENEGDASDFGLSVIDKMNKFSMGNSFKKAIFSYIKERKMYEDKTNSFHKLFKQLDTNDDGTVGKEELYAKYGEMFPGTPENEWKMIQELIEKFDIDGSGCLDYSEFILLSGQLNKQLSEGKLREIFNFFDRSGDGYINADDLEDIFEDQDLSSDKLQQMIDDYDKDGDRQLSFEEFVHILDQNV